VTNYKVLYFDTEKTDRHAR